jgi:hypothetical protein
MVPKGLGLAMGDAPLSPGKPLLPTMQRRQGFRRRPLPAFRVHRIASQRQMTLSGLAKPCPDLAVWESAPVRELSSATDIAARDNIVVCSASDL